MVLRQTIVHDNFTNLTTRNLMIGDYIEKRLEESQVINLIIEKAKCTYGNLDYFWEVTNVPRTEYLNFDKYYITKEISRIELGFEKEQNPISLNTILEESNFEYRNQKISYIIEINFSSISSSNNHIE